MVKIKSFLILLFTACTLQLYSQTTGLTGIITIDDGKTVTNNPEKKVSLVIEARGAVEMMLSNNGSYTGARWEKYETRKPYWRLTGEDGVKTIYAKFRDADGNISETVTATIELDRTAPQEPSVLINGGKDYTNNRAKIVSLEISAIDAVKMQVSNRTDFLSAPWVPYQTEIKAWKITAMEGKKTVFVKFIDKAGNISEVATDDIHFDMTPPVNCKVVIENGDKYTNKQKIKLKIDAEGASEMIIRGGEGWIPYTKDLEWEISAGDGKKDIYIKFRDDVGNQSVIAHDDILVDTKPPANGLILINNGSKYTRKFNDVHLKILATDAKEMIIDNDSTFKNGKWVGYSSAVPSWIVEDTDGVKNIFVKFRDEAGNESEIYSDEIILDKTAPTNPFIRMVTENAVFDSIAGHSIISNDAKVVNLQINADSADYMMISNISSFYGARWEKYKSKVDNWELGGNNDGDRSVFVKFRDRAGNISEVAFDQAKVDTQAPVDCRIIIDNNTEFCIDTDRNVKLQLFARGAQFMMVSNDPTFSNSTWQNYNTDINWQLSDKDGIKTVLVKYKDKAGNESEITSDEIILDRQPPTAGSILVDKGLETTNHPDKVVLVKVKAKDAELMQLGNSDDFKNSRWQAYSNLNFSWVLAGSDGDKQIFVRFKDIAGNISQAYGDSILLDRTPPKEGTVEINAGDKITNNTNKKVKLKLYAEDVSLMRLSNRFDFKEPDGSESNWIPYSESAEWTLIGPDGLKTVYVQFKDEIGNISKTAFARIGVDRQAPKQGRISIDRGAKFCTNVSAFVTLDLYAVEAAYMMVSNNQNFEGSDWIPYKGIYQNWPLESSEDGDKKVYVKFKDKADNETTPIVASITLDRQEPVGEEVIINGGGLDYTNDKTNNVELELKAEGAIEMMISNSSHFKTAKWQPYTENINWTLIGGDGTKVIYVKFRDEANNESAVASAKIRLDTQPPIAQYVRINGGQTTTKSTRVTLDIKAREADFMKVSNDPKFEGAIWEPYTPTKEWDVNPGEGLKRVFVKFKDNAQNESPHKWGDITLVNEY
ncbi:hypothetical protein [Chondrinema litorale]|uniref:hypothetical protein n=1 Tax=Chondrinema litorale TaxID=2994555 RepID=UPI002542808A|nr:hypothetical protein [Chondrinema litorale]UZR94657.1 hypothetical protein OQ292_02345 [Chondrinema litorale]